MTKRQLIDDIRQYNTTAAPQFLAQFDETALQQYLSHLTSARQKHLSLNRVTRPRSGVTAAAGSATGAPSPAAA